MFPASDTTPFSWALGAPHFPGIPYTPHFPSIRSTLISPPLHTTPSSQHQLNPMGPGVVEKGIQLTRPLINHFDFGHQSRKNSFVEVEWCEEDDR